MKVKIERTNKQGDYVNVGTIKCDKLELNFMKNATLTTYEEYDETADTQYIKEFTVSLEWLKAEVSDLFDQSVEGFMDSYTWDNSEWIFRRAKSDGVLVDPESSVYG